MLLPTRYQILTEIIASMLILLFVYTASSKLLAFSFFVAVLKTSPFMGEKAIMVAWLLPLMELAIACLLFLPRFRRQGLKAAFLMMCLFTCYIGCMLLFAPHLPCSCGGVLKSMSWRAHLLFNGFFMSLALWGSRLSAKRPHSNLNTA